MQGLSVPEPVLDVAVGTPVSAEEVKAMTRAIAKLRSRKVNGYVRAKLALEAARRSARSGTIASCFCWIESAT